MILAQKLLGKTPRQKMLFLHRVLELLRRRHNAWGEDFRNGVITEAQFRNFQENFFEPRNKLVHRVLAVIREGQGITNFTKEQLDSTAVLQLEGENASQYDVDIDIENIE